jgi:hypothetical protein
MIPAQHATSAAYAALVERKHTVFRLAGKDHNDKIGRLPSPLSCQSFCNLIAAQSYLRPTPAKPMWARLAPLIADTRSARTLR